MKKFNLNDYMYIQITEEGWRHLEKTVGIDYINACIKTPNHTHVINGETWYRLQCWSCFDLMPPNFGGRALFNTNVMFDDEAIANAKLIASAPELLAACQWAVEQFKRLADEGRYPEFMLSQNGGEGVMPLTRAIKRATEL